jgi:uncharacterized protein
MATPKANRLAHALLGAAAFCGGTGLVANTAHAFDCAKAYLGVDYVICSDPKLIASIDDMGQVWQRIKAATPADQFSALLADQRQWLKSYGTECGLPSKGQPTEQQIAKAAPCVSARINERLKYLTGLDKPVARPASAGYAWKTGFAQGIFEVSIRNDADSVFTVTCPSGQLDTAPSISYSTFRQLDASKGNASAFTLIIDDTKERLYLHRNGDFDGRQSYAWTAANDRQIVEIGDIVERIRSARYLAIEPTGATTRDEFSTRNAATALKDALRGCEEVVSSANNEAPTPATPPAPQNMQPSQVPPPPKASANPPDGAATMPACNSNEVQEKVTHAVFSDLSKVGVPMIESTRQYLVNSIKALTPDLSDLGRGAKQQMSLSTRFPAENIQICAEKPGVRSGIVAIVMRNPKRLSQWGVMVLNYGIPNRIATEGLEFLERQ